jgi:hypothetical protein
MGAAGGIWDGTSDTWSSIGGAATVRRYSDGSSFRLVAAARAGPECRVSPIGICMSRGHESLDRWGAIGDGRGDDEEDQIDEPGIGNRMLDAWG